MQMACTCARAGGSILGVNNRNPLLANGTALANQNDDKGIDGIDCSNITVKEMLFGNLYVRATGGADACLSYKKSVLKELRVPPGSHENTRGTAGLC